MLTELTVVSADEFLCARCAKHQLTCCQESEVYVTPGDVQRIFQATGSDTFYEFRKANNPIYQQENDDPFWIEHVFKSDGTRRVLKQRDNGDCHFLGSAGCVLPLETRPLICRLYPYDYTAAGLLEELARGCPLELLPPGADLLTILDISRTDALRWHQQLYQELLLEKQPPATQKSS